MKLIEDAPFQSEGSFDFNQYDDFDVRPLDESESPSE